MRNWLAKNTKMTYERFNAGEYPRIKALLFLTPEERDATEKTVLTWCTQKAEKSE